VLAQNDNLEFLARGGLFPATRKSSAAPAMDETQNCVPASNSRGTSWAQAGSGFPVQLFWCARGAKVNQRLKQLMKELGEAINESLSESEQIAEVISKIKAGGYDVFLVLEATIGFNKRDEQPAAAKPSLVNARKSDPDFKVSAQDVKFLKSLRITLDDAA
jgi:hypothetical protein